ncbi:integrase family protein [Lactiplantibacillus plantarum subsp. plantarum]|nr:integrase family protein [Lactiplantibacillus plantarum subsp. plantarum]
MANNRLSNSKANMTLGEYLMYWIDNLKVNVKVDTIQIHRRNIRFYINPRIGDYQLKDYSFNVHQKFINNLFMEEGAGRSKHGYGWNTVQSINQTLSNALEKAVRLDYIKVNPTRHVEFNRKYRHEVRKMRYFTKEQTDKFYRPLSWNIYHCGTPFSYSCSTVAYELEKIWLLDGHE